MPVSGLFVWLLLLVRGEVPLGSAGMTPDWDGPRGVPLRGRFVVMEAPWALALGGRFSNRGCMAPATPAICISALDTLDMACGCGGGCGGTGFRSRMLVVAGDGRFDDARDGDGRSCAPRRSPVPMEMAPEWLWRAGRGAKGWFGLPEPAASAPGSRSNAPLSLRRIGRSFRVKLPPPLLFRTCAVRFRISAMFDVTVGRLPRSTGLWLPDDWFEPPPPTTSLFWREMAGEVVVELGRGRFRSRWAAAGLSLSI